MSTPGAPPSDERKIATILFADIVGSTELASEEDPERVRARLERFYDAMGAEIEHAGGTVEKFAGDAVMASFGAPTALEDHAERALHAALAMQRRVRELFGDGLGLRIGVNTGEVVVGPSREGSSFVSGDSVNVAARLEQAAGAGEVLVGERTATAVRGAFEFDEPATVEAKGKRGGVEARRLVRALTLMRPRGIPGLGASFVGREGDLAALSNAYQAASRDARPRLVTILGDAGMGKTRLVREFWQWLGTLSPEPMRRTGRCLSYGQATTYWPLGEVLKEHLGILESDLPNTILARLGPRRILGLTLGLDVAGDLHPLQARDRLHHAWVEFLDALTAERPVVLFIEDIHWAEEPLLDLLERITDDVRGPLLVLTTARLELVDERPGWGARRPYAQTLTLEPLEAAVAGKMIDQLLAADLPSELRATVVERADGNPFFVEELVATLMDRGILERANGDWRVHELPAGFEVPDSVRSVLSARMDLLAPAEKGALQAASVIGRVFWTGPVYELLGDLEPDLRVLEERDFIRRRPGSSMAGEQEYAIKHALTTEVAYESLPRARRAQLHAAFAAWLERAEDGRDSHASVVAHHYAEAVRPEHSDLAWADDTAELTRLRAKAVEWLRRAAELAVGRYEIDEAVALLGRAVEHADSPQTTAALWRAIGTANTLHYDGEAFWTAMQRAIELSEDRETTAALYAELAFGTASRQGMWKRAPDRELVDDWIRRALELSEPETRARAKAMIAHSYWAEEKSSDVARDASALAERLGDVELRSYALDARLITAFAHLRFDEALTWAQRRLDLVPEITDPDHLADVYLTAIPVCAAAGRFREARRVGHLCDQLAASLTPHHRVHGVAGLLEIEELTAGWEAIRELTPRAAETVEENLDTPCVRNARCLLLCSLASAQLGDEESARRFEERSSEVALDGYDDVLAPPRIRLALIRGDLDLTERLLAASPPGKRYSPFLATMAARFDALAELGERTRLESEAEPFLHTKTYLAPFALRAVGRVREDGTLIRKALTSFEALKLDWHAAQTRALL
jgi:class 3 adenylate cyclase/tetratricopeptide (TPR) repeat protein